MFCDLHRIERSPFAEIIGYHPEIQAVRDRFIFPDAADVDLVFAGRIQRHGIELLGGIIVHNHPRHRRQQRAGFVRLKWPPQLHIDRFRMAAQHRNTHRRRRDAKRRRFKNLSSSRGRSSLPRNNPLHR